MVSPNIKLRSTIASRNSGARYNGCLVTMFTLLRSRKFRVSVCWNKIGQTAAVCNAVLVLVLVLVLVRLYLNKLGLSFVDAQI
jgi:hypothetical protein